MRKEQLTFKEAEDLLISHGYVLMSTEKSIISYPYYHPSNPLQDIMILPVKEILSKATTRKVYEKIERLDPDFS